MWKRSFEKAGGVPKPPPPPPPPPPPSKGVAQALMSLKLIGAILVIAAVPVCAQAQKPSAVTKADAQKVVNIISGDKAKTQTYCDMTKLGEQIEQANEKRDHKMVNELSQKLVALGEKLGVPEYADLMDGLEDINPNSKVGREIESVLLGLDRLCAR